MAHGALILLALIVFAIGVFATDRQGGSATRRTEIGSEMRRIRFS